MTASLTLTGGGLSTNTRGAGGAAAAGGTVGRDAGVAADARTRSAVPLGAAADCRCTGAERHSVMLPQGSGRAW